MKPIDLIVCSDINGGIGYKNQIPWDIYVDRVFFNNTTTMTRKIGMKNAVLMGRNTFESLQSPLPDRLNIVISSKKIDNVITFSSIQNALEFLNQQDNIETIFVIGGKKIYETFLECYKQYIRYFYWNEIQKEYQCDVFISKTSMLLKHRNQFLVKDGNESVNVIFKKYCKANQFLDKNENEELQYIQVLKELVKKPLRQTRNGNTSSSFNKQLVFDMKNGFPLLTSKKVEFKHVVEELLWFLKGETNSKILEQKGVNIWKSNSSQEFLNQVGLNYQEGDIGAMYGFQLVHFGEEYLGMDKKYNGYNQIDYVVNLIKNDPTSRRIIMTTYNPKQAKEGVLYPCHGIVTQFYVEDDTLHLSTYQRSADVFLGLPWNIASYSLLLHIISNLTNKKPGKVIITLGDYHLYEEHVDKAIIQILRSKIFLFNFPTLKMKEFTSISELDSSYFEIENYRHYKALVAKMKA